MCYRGSKLVGKGCSAVCGVNTAEQLIRIEQRILVQKLVQDNRLHTHPWSLLQESSLDVVEKSPDQVSRFPHK